MHSVAHAIMTSYHISIYLHISDGAFPDALPFLKWCQRQQIATGVISNADERYGDSILPMLGLSDDMRFLTFSKNTG